jgi:hypothetical protein
MCPWFGAKTAPDHVDTSRIDHLTTNLEMEVVVAHQLFGRLKVLVSARLLIVFLLHAVTWCLFLLSKPD